MARYVFETVTGKQVQLEDYIFSEMGIEGIQATETPGKYVMILFMGDGSMLYDYESGKTPEDLKKSKEQYKALMLEQNKQMAATAERLVAEANGVEVITDEDGEPETEVPYTEPSFPAPDGMYR
jgi:hypothetical protein